MSKPTGEPTAVRGSKPGRRAPEVVELFREEAERDIVLRLTERDYQHLSRRVQEGGFDNLHVYLNYLLAVGEQVVENRRLRSSPFSAFEGTNKKTLSFDARVARELKENPRYSWLSSVLDEVFLEQEG